MSLRGRISKIKKHLYDAQGKLRALPNDVFNPMDETQIMRKDVILNQIGLTLMSLDELKNDVIEGAKDSK